MNTITYVYINKSDRQVHKTVKVNNISKEQLQKKLIELHKSKNERFMYFKN